MKRIFCVLVVIGLLILPDLGVGYSPDTTHRFLSQKAAQILVNEYPQYQEITFPDNLAVLMKGAEEEDDKYPIGLGFATRSKNHYLRPVDGSGWHNIMEIGSENLYINAHQWAIGNEYNWDMAVEAYLKRDFPKAFECLGHIVHLIQDCSVPAHSQIDTHAVPFVGDDYENYCAHQTVNDYLAYLPQTPINIPETKTDIPRQKLKDLIYAVAWASYNLNRFQAKPPANFDGQWTGELAEMFDIAPAIQADGVGWYIEGIGYLGEDWWECELDPGYYYIENTGLDTPVPHGWDKHLCEKFADEMIPLAISYTAAVYKLFFETAAKEMPPIISFYVEGKKAGEVDTVILAEGTRPDFKYEWQNTEEFGTFRWFGLFWNNKWLYKTPVSPDESADWGTTWHFFHESGYFQLVGETDQEDSRFPYGYFQIWTPSIYIKVVPHHTVCYVSQQTGSDEQGDGTKENPYASISRAMRMVSNYWNREKERRQTVVDKVFVGPGVYDENIDSTVPVEISAIGGPSKTVIDGGIFISPDTRGSRIKGFRFTGRIKLYSAQAIIENNVFTAENWDNKELDKRAQGSAIAAFNCGSGLQIISNTFKVSQRSRAGAIMLWDSSPLIYDNVFDTEGVLAIYSTGSSSPGERGNIFSTKEEVAGRGAQVETGGRGDFDADGRVGLDDFMVFIQAYGSSSTDENWSFFCDVNFDGVIDIKDFKLFVQSFSARQRAKMAGMLGLDLPGIEPQAFRLLPNFPNPFNQSTAISYCLSADSQVELKIYNLLGQQVMRLIDVFQPAGEYRVMWDGRDGAGQSLSSGTYILCLKAGGFEAREKIIIVR